MKIERFKEREVMTAERMNELVDLLESADDRARSATRLLWFSILLTAVDIVLVLQGVL